MDKNALEQKIINDKNRPELSKYVIDYFLPDSHQTRNLICFAHDSKDKLAIKFSTNPSLENEYNLMNELHNHNIMEAKSFIKTEDYYGIVMPLALGGDLLELRSNSKLLQSEIRDIMRSLFTALDFLHKSGIMHRDVKIENIFVMGKNVSSEIVLGDLEFATKNNYSRDYLGTPAFMAPEMFHGLMYDNKIDLWSAGVVMYLTCFSELPFDHKDPSYTLKFKEDVEVPISDEAKDLMSCLLCVDPNKRYSAEQALGHPWFCLNLQQEEVNMHKTGIRYEIDNFERIASGDLKS